MLDIEQVLDLLWINSEKETVQTNNHHVNTQLSKLETHILREIDRFKVSYCLKMEIGFEDICGIHIQKLPSGKHNWALLVLKLSKKPNFFTRRIMCADETKNQVKQRSSDFTFNNVASKYDTHYIIGDERELKRILSLMIKGDADTGHIEKLYREGLSDISFPTKPAWQHLETPQKKVDRGVVTMPMKLLFEPKFICKEDELEEQENSKYYDSDEGTLPYNVSLTNYDAARKYERKQVSREDLEKENHSECADECFIQ